MLQIKNLTIKDLKNHILIENFNYSLGNNDKVGIIGEEGNGKSTLLKAIKDKILIEDYTVIEGDIVTDFQNIAYFEQHIHPKWKDVQLYEYLLKKDVEDEIELEIDCFIPQELSIQPDVLAVILGNCLDNSISACLRLTDKSERTLSLNIRYFQQNLFISINNTFNEQEQETRKTRQRDGWGLRTVDSLVQEYQGTIKRFKENGHYRTEILLPSPIN